LELLSMAYDRTWIEIRERSFLDLLDLAILAVRDRPVTLGLAALAGILPWAALNIRLLSDPEFPLPLWLALLILETPWATAPLTLALGDLMFEQQPRPGTIMKTLLNCLPGLILSQFLLRGLLLVLVITYPVMPAQYGFLNEVILLERVSIFRARAGRDPALRRSRSLSHGFESEYFLRWLGQIFLGSIFAFCFWMGARTVSSTLAGEELTWYQPGLADLAGLLFQAGVWIAIAFFAVFRFLSYIDRRIRLEGWELELRLRAVGRALEEKRN
jgi:hypothetical protein